MNSIIEARNVCMDFAIGDGSIVHALKGINLQIPPNRLSVLRGRSGSGKTTLMKALLGLLKPLSGSITYSDGLKQNEIGYLPQSSDIQRDFPASVQEVVLSGCLNKKHTFFYSKEQKKTAAEN